MIATRVTLFLSLLLFIFAGCRRESGEPGGTNAPPGKAARVVLRFGHFPNVTHAQGLVAYAMSKRAERGKGKGWFEERLGGEVEKIEWFVYNAGPSAMEAIFARSLDLTYVGPSPALNAYVKSRGDEVRIIAGAAEGGSALVVQGDGRIQKPEDFRGRKVATPQLGNTQDVVCRAWLIDHGFKVTQLGGDVHVLPTANPDQLSLFLKGVIDSVWTVEPWVSRLETEAGGKVFLEEKEAITTVLACREGFLREHPEIARKVARAHAELTEWIQKNQEEAHELVREALKEETTRDMPPELLKRSFARLRFTASIEQGALEKFVAAAQRVGFLRDAVPLSRLVVPQ